MARKYNQFTRKLEYAWSAAATQWTTAPTTIPTKVWEEYLDTVTGTWYKSIGTTSVDDRVAL